MAFLALSGQPRIERICCLSSVGGAAILPRVSIDSLTFIEEQVLGEWFPDAPPATP